MKAVTMAKPLSTASCSAKRARCRDGLLNITPRAACQAMRGCASTRASCATQGSVPRRHAMDIKTGHQRANRLSSPAHRDLAGAVGRNS